MTSTLARKAAAANASAVSPGITTTLIILAVIGGTIYLTAIDKLDGQAFVAIVSGVIGGVLVRAGVASGSAATSAPPPQD